MNPGASSILISVRPAKRGSANFEENQEMKISRTTALRTIPYLLLAVAMLVIAYPMTHVPAIHADDQQVPAVGTIAPDFTLDSQEGTPISLHSYRGKWVVLYFYPKDRSEEHTSELQSLRHLVCRLLLEKKQFATRPKTPEPVLTPSRPATLRAAHH